MRFKGWDKGEVVTTEGKLNAIFPIIISASRATDIPAFYADWFMNKLKNGYVKWINPFNRENSQFISFGKTRLIVFWTKNAKPLMKYLKEIDKREINYYFQFTVNDYEDENFESGVPKLADRIEIFKELSDIIGREKVIWRFDPLILTDKIDVQKLLYKIYNVGNEINKYTEKLVISFVDVEIYNKVKKNIKSAGINYRKFEKEDMEKIAEGIREINKEWKLEVTTCAEGFELDKYEIKHNKCIDDNLIIKLFKNDKILMNFLGLEAQNSLFEGEKNRRIALKDRGQRKECGCIISKDIGQYNTCGHLCIYCYAN